MPPLTHTRTHAHFCERMHFNSTGSSYIHPLLVCLRAALVGRTRACVRVFLCVRVRKLPGVVQPTHRAVNREQAALEVVRGAGGVQQQRWRLA